MVAGEEEKNYDRTKELKAFDETKSGVKGLVDEGITKVPKIFYSKPCNFLKPSGDVSFNIPVVNLSGIDLDVNCRREVVERVREATETWGFFQVVNHSIPLKILDEMLEGVRRFYEQDNEVKKKWYTRDGSKTVVYNSNFDLYTVPSANWRDTFFCIVAPNPPSLQELPPICR